MLSLARNFLGLPLAAFAGGEETKDKIPCPCLLEGFSSCPTYMPFFCASRVSSFS